MLRLLPNGLLVQHNTAPYSKTQVLNKQQNAFSALRMFVKRVMERIMRDILV